MKRILSMLAACFLSAMAAAQMGGPPPPPTLTSLDTSIQDARTIAIGTVSAVPAYNPAYEGQPVRLAVTETLKGKPSPSLLFYAEDYAGTFAYRMKHKYRMLVLLPADPHANALVFNLHDPKLAVMTKDLRTIHGAKDVVAELRRIIAEHEPIRRKGAFELLFAVPHDNVLPGRHSFDDDEYAYLKVPFDSSLEHRAKEYLDPKNERLRDIGIEALSYFPSLANVDLIRPLMMDERDWQSLYRVVKNKLLRISINYVRKAAYTALRRMGEAVPRDEDTTRPADPNRQVIAVNLDSGVVSDADIADLRNYPSLKDLYLSNGKFTPTQYEAISGLDSLQTLFLECTNVTDGDIETLSRLPNLIYLGLTNTSVTDACVESMARLKSLKTVDLGGKITDAGIERLRNLRPDIKARPDELAFLAPLHPVVFEYPHLTQEGKVFFMAEPSDKTAGIRWAGYALPYGKYSTAIDLLFENLPRQGWHIGSYSRFDAKGFRKDTKPGDVIFARARDSYLTKGIKGAVELIVYKRDATPR